MGRRWKVDRLRHPAVPLVIATDAQDGALLYVGLGGRLAPLVRLARRYGAAVEVDVDGRSSARRQLSEYLAGKRRRFQVELRPLGSAFSLDAWAALRAIPFGQTRSYGEQADAIGAPKAARAVGRANGANPLPIVIPCHRVIGASGSLTGFSGGVEIKRWLLELERRRRVPSWQPRARARGVQLGLFG